MSNIAIKVEKLSKAYQLGEIGTGTISRDLERWFARVRGKEDPFLKIGETNDRARKGTSDIVWSLKDINFEIEQGDAVGIIGRNGAGKSTLLKILSRVTSPTTGKISGKGRIASLLEVGTGFHPELTGRENIFLNGAILGMRKREIQRKFDEIVDFAGVERYVDTPVKRYSSGMYVRLAFAVAAHLESEILIVDEVLAVGDAEFQKKCLGKMGEVSKGEGRTVLFVSHNMGSIKTLCRKSILLVNGELTALGQSHEIINKYQSVTFRDFKAGFWKNEIIDENDKAQLVSISVAGINSQPINTFQNSEDIVLLFVVIFKQQLSNVKVGFDVIRSGELLFTSYSVDMDPWMGNVAPGSYSFRCVIPAYLLNHGCYLIRPQLSIHCASTLTRIDYPVLEIEICFARNNPFHTVYNENNHPGFISPFLKWAIV